MLRRHARTCTGLKAAVDIHERADPRAGRVRKSGRGSAKNAAQRVMKQCMVQNRTRGFDLRNVLLCQPCSCERTRITI